MRRVVLVAALTGLASLSSAASEKIEVTVKVAHVSIENRPTRVSFKTVCKLKSIIDYADVRSNRIQNSIPAKIAQGCQIDILGKKENLMAYAGGGIYLEREPSGNVKDQYTYTGSFNSETFSGQVWGVSSEEFNDDLSLVFNTETKVHPTNPQKTESLRITYTFVKK
jgi:hypothetical protein